MGFSLLEVFAEQHGLGKPGSKVNYLYWSANIEGCPVIMVMPQTYMNLSGEAVKKVVKNIEIEPEDILVLHDEVDFDCGTFKFKLGGGEAGHKGLKSISQCLSTQNYTRMRIGVGPKGDVNLAEFVLKRFSKKDLDVILCNFPKMLTALGYWCRHGTKEAMNHFNGSE